MKVFCGTLVLSLLPSAFCTMFRLKLALACQSGASSPLTSSSNPRVLVPDSAR
ncbi:hypothetical protein D3C86_2188410 [compost metagenome]